MIVKVRIVMILRDVLTVKGCEMVPGYWKCYGL